MATTATSAEGGATQGGNGHVDEERLALVSVLQELTVAALELFDPRSSADAFLERMTERLGCFAALLIRVESGGRPTLYGASGLSPVSRARPIAADATHALLEGEACDVLPYRELARHDLSCWRLPVLTPARAVLLVFFVGEPPLPGRYRGMLRRLADVLGRVLDHRDLFARSIESERRLEEKKTVIECLSEASPEGVLFIDTAGEIVFFNRRFVAMWGLDADAIARGRAHVLRVTSAQVADEETFLARTAKIREHPYEESLDEFRMKDGRIIERQSRPVRTASGGMVGLALFFRDITSHKEADAEREARLATEQSARASAEEAIRARDDFLSIASHELRTPLTSLLLATEQVVRGTSAAALPPQTVRLVQNVRKQAQRLVRLVDGLLDVARIQSGHLELDLEEMDLVEVVTEVVMRLEGGRSGIVLHTPGPVIGTWDRSRLDQVATNLISNAIKYGRGNPIDVTVRADEEIARLEVRDRGIGIDVEHVARLFRRFERAVSSRQYGGLGLGLFIVRQIVEMHGGTVTVESVPEQGSTFTVTLPRSR